MSKRGCTHKCKRCKGLGVVFKSYPSRGPYAWHEVELCPNAPARDDKKRVVRAIRGA